jgi:hypothetical protein
MCAAYQSASCEHVVDVAIRPGCGGHTASRHKTMKRPHSTRSERFAATERRPDLETPVCDAGRAISLIRVQKDGEAMSRSHATSGSAPNCRPPSIRTWDHSTVILRRRVPPRDPSSLEMYSAHTTFVRLPVPLASRVTSIVNSSDGASAETTVIAVSCSRWDRSPPTRPADAGRADRHRESRDPPMRSVQRGSNRSTGTTLLLPNPEGAGQQNVGDLADVARR